MLPNWVRGIFPSLRENLSGLEPGELPVAVGVVEEGTQGLAVPGERAAEALHAVEFKAKEAGPREAEFVEARVACDLLAVDLVAVSVAYE